METQPIRLRREMTVTALHSIHYIEMTKNYVFSGEQHDYWEVLYVDRGNVLVTLDEETFPAVAGNLIFIAPGEFHAFRCDNTHPANVMLVAFECKSPKMQMLKDLRLQSFSDTILRFILKYCKSAFEKVLSDPYDHRLVRKADAFAGEEAFISITITEMLLTAWRGQVEPLQLARPVLGGKAMINAITEYMQTHLSSKLTIKQIEEEFHISKSYIQRLFARYKQTGAMHYFTELKMERARELLRARELNVTKIAEQLGYDNVYHFCNQFKKYVKMSPLEYRKSIRNFYD